MKISPSVKSELWQKNMRCVVFVLSRETKMLLSHSCLWKIYGFIFNCITATPHDVKIRIINSHNKWNSHYVVAQQISAGGSNHKNVRLPSFSLTILRMNIYPYNKIHHTWENSGACLKLLAPHLIHIRTFIRCSYDSYCPPWKWKVRTIEKAWTFLSNCFLFSSIIKS